MYKIFEDIYNDRKSDNTMFLIVDNNLNSIPVNLDEITEDYSDTISENIEQSQVQQQNEFEGEEEQIENENSEEYVNMNEKGEEYININTSGRGYIEKGIKLTERNKVDLDSLILDINEYREKIALDRFYNFLTINMPPTLDNLDDDD